MSHGSSNVKHQENISRTIMGNTASNEKTSKKNEEGVRGNKKAKLYSYVDMHGGGELIPWMRYARETGDYSIIDEFIDTKVVEFQ